MQSKSGPDHGITRTGLPGASQPSQQMVKRIS